MKYYEFVKAHPDLFSKLGNTLRSNKVDIMEDVHNPNLPYVNSSVTDYLSGFYLKKNGYEDWSAADYIAINSLFPMKYDEYDIKLMDISDTDSDDDRLYPATISFAIFENGKSVLQ